MLKMLSRKRASVQLSVHCWDFAAQVLSLQWWASAQPEREAELWWRLKEVTATRRGMHLWSNIRPARRTPGAVLFLSALPLGCLPGSFDISGRDMRSGLHSRGLCREADTHADMRQRSRPN